MKKRYGLIFSCAAMSGMLLGSCVPTDKAAIDELAAEVLSGLPDVGVKGAAVPTKTSIPPTPEPTLGAGSTMISAVDGMEMIYVPQGEFTMGIDEGRSNEEPEHQVTLTAYWIDKSEVTNAMYAQCVAAKACEQPGQPGSSSQEQYYGNPIFADYPVIYVSWHKAQAYCKWAGRQLPTEAQWEKAARGTDGRLYPWGKASPTNDLVNFKENVGDTKNVCSYPGGNSPYGACDMAGNVLEWVFDWYDADYYDTSPLDNPTGPGSSHNRVQRGGSWYFDEHNIRTYNRLLGPPGWKGDPDLGFRCALPIP